VSGEYLILRTAWVYSTRRDSFISKVLQWARQNETLRIVDDQISSPTWARMLAQVTALLLARADDNFHPWLVERKGVYHLAGDGFASRLEWARKILALDPHHDEQVCKEILPALTSDFPTPAQRPLFSALDCSLFERTFSLKLPGWQDSLCLAVS
jgi:dTDP-4-dehydrorhamnose reductase